MNFSGPKKQNCDVNGKIYGIGEIYVTKDCSIICRCNGNAPPQCHALCPKRELECTHAEYKVREQESVKGSNCTCTVSKCIKKDVIINSHDCGRSQRNQTPSNQFVIGGRQANHGDWPWMIAVVKAHSPNKIYCGATLLNTQWALSAAHCFRKPFKNDPKLYMLKIGAHKLQRKGWFFDNLDDFIAKMQLFNIS